MIQFLSLAFMAILGQGYSQEVPPKQWPEIKKHVVLPALAVAENVGHVVYWRDVKITADGKQPMVEAEYVTKLGHTCAALWPKSRADHHEPHYVSVHCEKNPDSIPPPPDSMIGKIEDYFLSEALETILDYVGKFEMKDVHQITLTVKPDDMTSEDAIFYTKPTSEGLFDCLLTIDVIVDNQGSFPDNNEYPLIDIFCQEVPPDFHKLPTLLGRPFSYFLKKNV